MPYGALKFFFRFFFSGFFSGFSFSPSKSKKTGKNSKFSGRPRRARDHAGRRRGDAVSRAQGRLRRDRGDPPVGGRGVCDDEDADEEGRQVRKSFFGSTFLNDDFQFFYHTKARCSLYLSLSQFTGSPPGSPSRASPSSRALPRRFWLRPEPEPKQNRR